MSEQYEHSESVEADTQDDEQQQVEQPSSTASAYELGQRTLQRGMSGDDVAHVQRLLDVDEDDYGAATEAAVRRYQGARGLHRDGAVGSATWQKLLRDSS